MKSKFDKDFIAGNSISEQDMLQFIAKEHHDVPVLTSEMNLFTDINLFDKTGASSRKMSAYFPMSPGRGYSSSTRDTASSSNYSTPNKSETSKFIQNLVSDSKYKPVVLTPSPTGIIWLTDTTQYFICSIITRQTVGF